MGDPARWASPQGARAMGYSPEVNPWSQGLEGTPNAALPKEASAYSGLHQHYQPYVHEGYNSYNIYDDTSIPKGDTERWASESDARSMGWSQDINPWSKPLNGATNAALERSASAYTGLSQQQMIRNFTEKAIEPWVWDKVSEPVRDDYKPATWNSLSYRPSLPPMTIWPASSEFPPILYENTTTMAPVDEPPK